MRRLKATKPYPVLPALLMAMYCPRRGYRIEPDVCRKMRSEGRKKCDRAHCIFVNHEEGN